MSFIAEATIREVNERADILAVAGDYVRLDKKGGRYWGLCPFHNEKTPSFTVDPDRKMYYCFGCGQGGGVINFLMEMEKLSYPEALESLAKRFGIEIVYESGGGGQAASEGHKRKDELHELYRRSAGSFHHILLNTPGGAGARDYLKDRGISAAMIDRFRLGYAPQDRNWLFRFLSGKGYSEAFLASSGLFSRNNARSSFFGDRLMFPIADRQGNTVAFGGRILSGDGPKYLNSAESEIYKKRETLFAVDLAIPEIRRTKEVYIAEGYMDVIALHQAGVENAVAPLGTAFTDEQARLLRRWAEGVVLVFDNDEAGQNAAVKSILICRRNGLNCSVVFPDTASDSGAAGDAGPGYKDPADILKDAGEQALQKFLKCTINDFEYLVKRSRSLYDISDSRGKAQAVAFLFPYAETFDSEVSRDACLAEIADVFGADRSAVLHDFGRRNEPKRDSHPIKGAETRRIRMNEELFLLTAVFVNPELYPRLRSGISMEEFEDSDAKEMYIALEEWFRNDSPGRDDLISRIRDEGVKKFVIEKSASEAFTMEPDKLVSESIFRLKEKRLERRRAEIVTEMRFTGHGENPSHLEDLLSEKVFIDAQLRRHKENE